MFNTNHTFAICAYKESPYLRECIASLRKQSVKTNIIMATSTPCDYIADIAKEYNIPLYINDGESGITQDWNFAYSKANTDYITIAHQDDVYSPKYVESLLASVEGVEKPLIFFTNYGEIRDGKKVLNSKLLQIKRFMLLPLRIKALKNVRWIRRMCISFGSSICCPSVTMYRPNLPNPVFLNHFRSNEDWEAWERVSRIKGSFIYNENVLMFHRIHDDSETSKIIQDNKRSIEDYEMFRKFWPKPIAKLLTKAYSSSQKYNEV